MESRLLRPVRHTTADEGRATPQIAEMLKQVAAEGGHANDANANPTELIDRAFVNEVLLRKDARAIVQMIAQLAATLGMRTVCEGVESAQQLAVVAKAGCHEVQGYLVSPPKPLAEASPDFRFAAAVAGWGMLLRDSEHKGLATFQMVLELAQAAKGDDPFGYRAEFLRLVTTSEAVR